MTQTKKGNQWHFGMKAHIGVDADSGFTSVRRFNDLADWARLVRQAKVFRLAHSSCSADGFNSDQIIDTV